MSERTYILYPFYFEIEFSLGGGIGTSPAVSNFTSSSSVQTSCESCCLGTVIESYVAVFRCATTLSWLKQRSAHNRGWCGVESNRKLNSTDQTFILMLRKIPIWIQMFSAAIADIWITASLCWILRDSSGSPAKYPLSIATFYSKH